jgi:hypothetical protein
MAARCKLIEKDGERGRNRTYNLLIKSHNTFPANQQDSPLPSAESGKVLQNPQPPRNQEQQVPPTKSAKTAKPSATSATNFGDDRGGYPHEP